MVETQLCKLRDASDTFVGRAYSVSHVEYGVCELTYDIVVTTQFHMFFGTSFARVLCLILMKDIGR